MYMWTLSFYDMLRGGDFLKLSTTSEYFIAWIALLLLVLVWMKCNEMNLVHQSKTTWLIHRNRRESVLKMMLSVVFVWSVRSVDENWDNSDDHIASCSLEGRNLLWTLDFCVGQSFLVSQKEACYDGLGSTTTKCYQQQFAITQTFSIAFC